MRVDERLKRAEATCRELEREQYLRALTDRWDLARHCWLADLGALQDPGAETRARDRTGRNAGLTAEDEALLTEHPKAAATIERATDGELWQFLAFDLWGYFHKVEELFGAPDGEARLLEYLRGLFGMPELAAENVETATAARLDALWGEICRRGEVSGC